MRRALVLLPAFLVLPLLLCNGARAANPWEESAAWKALIAHEAKSLEGLLRLALKKDYRRQAWYLAERIVAIAPTQSQAVQVLETWDGQGLQRGMAPKKAFLKKRDGVLRKLGDAYVHFGESLEAGGLKPAPYDPLSLRAHAYGSQAPALLAALASQDAIWMGVYGPKPRSEVENLLAGPPEEFRFPEEFDDDYLKARAVWEEARGAIAGHWRLMTDHGYKESLRLLGMLAAQESWMVAHMGSRARHNDEELTDLLVFEEWQKYDKIGAELIPTSERERFAGTSGWYDPRKRRLLVCWHHRDGHPLGDDDLMLGHAARVMARRHLAGGAGGLVTGRGAWLLEGLRGAFEAFGLDEEGAGRIQVGACWRLAVARALREAEELLPWPQFFDLDRDQMAALTRPTLRVTFGGTSRETQNVNVAAAQATALVVGIMKADGGKRLKKFAKLIGDLYKRDSLPDIDKTLGWKKGRAIKEANVAMDAVLQGSR